MAMKFKWDIPASNSEGAPYPERYSGAAMDLKQSQIKPVWPVPDAGGLSGSVQSLLSVLPSCHAAIRTWLRPFFLAFITAALLPGCFSTPGWIHELPTGSAQGPGDGALLDGLAGKYVRPVSTRYSIADPHSLSSSTHTLEITSGERPSYYKIHSYEEWVRGVAYRTIYGEKGIVQRQGPWVLLVPRTAYRRSQGPVTMDEENSDRRCVAALDAAEVRRRLDIRKKLIDKEPLLYFWSDQDNSLTPLAFEEEGEVFRFGFYEQLMRPYDSGAMLQATQQDYNLKLKDPHGYFKEGSEFLQRYSRDPAQDIQKELNLPGNCVQDFRLSQSSR
jgi:hypothetical protein